LVGEWAENYITMNKDSGLKAEYDSDRKASRNDVRWNPGTNWRCVGRWQEAARPLATVLDLRVAQPSAMPIARTCRAQLFWKRFRGVSDMYPLVQVATPVLD
jgi:hypothetical protein